jgi:hypothetical protein
MLDRAYRFLASLRLTVVCLCLATLLVFIGTLAQVNEGLYQAQDRYFRSLLVWWPVPGTGIKLLFPGGYLVGGVLLLNLLAGHLTRFGLSRKKLGIFMVHIGLILLLVGQLLTDMLSVESHMRLREGETKDFSESGSVSELAIIETGLKDGDRVTSVSEAWMSRKADIQQSALPFTIRIKDFFLNSAVSNRLDTALQAASSQGIGANAILVPQPNNVRMDRRNMPSAVLEILGADGASQGTWLASLWVERPQAFSVGGRSFEFVLRPARLYKPMTLTLVDFRHDKYPGTEIPKNFSSRVRLQNASKGEDREVVIFMNNPLRYAGETYYQSGYDEDDPKVTILQVVRNPGWLTPYLACVLVSLGLVVQFGMHLMEFARQRRRA